MLMTLQLPTSGVPTLENEGNSQAPRSDKQTKSSINPDLTCVPNGLELDVKFSLEFPAPILSRRPSRNQQAIAGLRDKTAKRAVQIYVPVPTLVTDTMRFGDTP